MKTILTTLAIFLTLSIQKSARASGLLGLHFPIQKANLTEVDRDGHELDRGLKRELSAQKRGNRFLFSSFTFLEEKGAHCSLASCPVVARSSDYVVVYEEKDSCGSVKLTALEKADWEQLSHLDPLPSNGSPKRSWIEVTDHSHRLCDDYQKYNWEVRMFDRSNRNISSRYLEGNAEVFASLDRGWAN